jgi:hypothetical protein
MKARRVLSWRGATFETIRRTFVKVAVRVEELNGRIKLAVADKLGPPLDERRSEIKEKMHQQNCDASEPTSPSTAAPASPE